MLKRAWAAVAAGLAVAMAMSVDIAARPAVATVAESTDEMPCRSAETLPQACDANADTAAVDAALPPEPGGEEAFVPAGGLGFQDVANEPGTTLPSARDADGTRRLVPALMALGALLVLLRKRPG